ncbi:hypothetical protein JCM30566_19530 [Marinitoga arctica]
MKMKERDIKVEIKTPLMKYNKDSYKELQKFCAKNEFTYSPNPIIMSKTNGDVAPKKHSLDFNSLIEFYRKFPSIVEKNDLENKTFLGCSSLDKQNAKVLKYLFEKERG